MAKSNASPMRVIEETPGYWRAIFDYPPFNVVDDDVFQALDIGVRLHSRSKNSALSSITGMFRERANATIGSMSADIPYR